MKGLTGLKTLGRDEVMSLVDHASSLRDRIDAGAPPEPVLGNRVVTNLFFEPSTRTRLSFDLAAQRLGAHVLTFDPATSSTIKGESLRDTGLTVAAMGTDIMVVRHQEEGVPDLLAGWTGLPVVNAGDGANEHPTQALLDVVTLLRRFGRLEGLRVGIVGDIAHSRVAGSLMHAFPTLGMDLRLLAPERWLPRSTALPTATDLDPMLGDLDVVYLLRVQAERGAQATDDYVRRFQIDTVRSSRLPEHAVIMHPGPMNRGVEISEEVADGPRSLVTEQVRNGVPTRMAVLSSVAGAVAR